MDFQNTSEQEAFRQELRGWLAAHLPRELCVDDPTDERVAPDRPTFEKRVAWQRIMCKAGWVGISWPREFGGRGATLMEQLIYDEECFRARAPVLPGYSGIGMIGPTLIEVGTHAQKARFVPRILTAEDIWCQGFSEPGAGSDLAGLQTRAVDKGDHFLVNGQKVWTSGAQFADWIYLLVRTDPAAPKHKGISYLLVDMKTPGITVRPLVLMNGHRHFNEVFFVDVAVPKENLVGKVNQGWGVAMTTLAYERGTVAKLHTGTRGKIAQLIDDARTTPLGDGRMATDDPVLREKLAAVYLDGELLKLISDRALSAELHGRAMGPEGSIAKLLWSETEQHVAELASDVLGPDALSGRWARDRVYSRALTIAGGTTQVNKNILAQRMLGLPRA